MTGDGRPDLPDIPGAASIARYMRATGWDTEGPQGTHGSVFVRGDAKIAVPHEDDDPDAVRMALYRLAAAERRAPAVTEAAVLACRDAGEPVKSCGWCRDPYCTGDHPGDAPQAPWPVMPGITEETVPPACPECTPADGITVSCEVEGTHERHRGKYAREFAGVSMDVEVSWLTSEPAPRPPCPAPCDPGCDAECHESHQPAYRRWHQPGWSCGEAARVVAQAVAAGRERAEEAEAKLAGIEALCHQCAERVRADYPGVGLPAVPVSAGSIMAIIGTGEADRG